MKIRIEPVAPLNGTHKLRYVISNAGTTATVSTDGTRINKKYLSKKDVRRPILAHPDPADKQRVDTMNDTCAAIHDRLMAAGASLPHDASATEIKAAFDRPVAALKRVENDKDPLFDFPALETFFTLSKNPRKKSEYNASTKSDYICMMQHFQDKFGKVRFSEINEDKWISFEKYLLGYTAGEFMVPVSEEEDRASRNLMLEHGFKPELGEGTVSKYFRKLGAVLRFYRKRGVVFPILEEQMIVPAELVKKVHLTMAQFYKLLAYTPANEKESRVKDLMVLQCVTALRISDLVRLEKSHIKSEVTDGEEMFYIDMTSFKSQKAMIIPLFEDIGMEIIRRHNFVLPVFQDGSVYNNAIRALIVAADIDAKIEWFSRVSDGPVSSMLSQSFTNHCCARTAIEYFAEKNYPVEKLPDMIGKSLATILLWYKPKATVSSILAIAQKSTHAVMKVSRKSA